jgi:hypothetical protein
VEDEFRLASCLDFGARRVPFVKVKRQIITAFLIGICITAFGGAAFVIDELFFPFTTIQSAKGVDYCLIVVFEWIFLPAEALFGDKGKAVVIAVTVIFWVCVVFLLMKAKKVINHWREISNR